ncbi:MAG: class D sortase [Ruminococcus flavefaciens]|nr:class D sortase [Ruminococcus flavefaciens]
MGYFGYNKISREIYKKKLLETSIIFEIPELKIKTPVLEGTDNETLKYSAGHFLNTGDLGKGNYCITGHSSTIYACVFDDLKYAETGMKMYLYSKDKICYPYIITEKKIINPSDTYVLDDYGDNRITVITCNDDGSQRICVIGKLDK